MVGEGCLAGKKALFSRESYREKNQTLLIVNSGWIYILGQKASLKKKNVLKVETVQVRFILLIALGSKRKQQRNYRFKMNQTEYIPHQNVWDVAFNTPTPSQSWMTVLQILLKISKYYSIQKARKSKSNSKIVEWINKNVT